MAVQTSVTQTGVSKVTSTALLDVDAAIKQPVAETQAPSKRSGRQQQLHFESVRAGSEMEELLRTLTSGELDVNVSNNAGFTPLHTAAMAGSQKSCETLLKYGADVDIADLDGHTALHWAVKKQRCTAAKVLIDAGANLDTQNTLGCSPLHEAAGSNSVLILSILLNAGASPSTTTQEGHTALHWATMCGHVEAVEELLQGASDPNALSKAGHTPLYIAMRSDHDGCVHALTEFGADMQLAMEQMKQQELTDRHFYASLASIKDGSDLLAEVGTHPQVYLMEQSGVDLKSCCSDIEEDEDDSFVALAINVS
eukprot:CAMPEP_0114255154 /NCGR_PEP_ID=MMETSP0058-20121206/17396_1 /TAXON_ID=36894 /ORGANISM="Pyramimonas parkeae, CCMP726" /LENGTH=310 /DNA_ID=CAMNT_0001369491 /DNA_START=137 /DNA_END=1070 /DNA_ORIENTATION=-